MTFAPFSYVHYALAWLPSQISRKSFPLEKFGQVPTNIRDKQGSHYCFALGEETGHRLPEAFVNAGVFETPATSSLKMVSLRASGSLSVSRTS